MVKLEFPSIQALVFVISGDSPEGQSALSPYRSGPKLMDFFRLLGFESDTYGAGFGSRKPYVQSKLEEANGKPIMAKIIASSVDPRHYLNTEFDIDSVIEYLNTHLTYDGYKIIPDGKGFSVVPEGHNPSSIGADIKNLIFATTAKPDIILKDALTNQIEVVGNTEDFLVYNRPITQGGLRRSDLVTWWQEEKQQPIDELATRLFGSLESDPERLLYRVYVDFARETFGDDFPALIPQVWFHYDPKTIGQLKGQKRLLRQRMDFLILLPHGIRVVLEVDGKHHYSEADKPSTQKYAEMVSEDRKLKLWGYDVYRFGGYEFMDRERPQQMLTQFLSDLFKRYGVNHTTEEINQNKANTHLDNLPF